MVKNVSVMIPQGYTTVPADKDIKKKVDEEHYSAARSSVVAAQDELNSNAPLYRRNSMMPTRRLGIYVDCN